MSCRPDTPWSPELIDESLHPATPLRALPLDLFHGPVYLAGPMRGLPQFNVRAFYRAEGELVAAGFRVVNPARHDAEAGVDLDAELPTDTFHKVMRWDLARVMESSAVFLLPGWEDSEGATLEVRVAQAVGVPVYALTPGVGAARRLR